MQADLSKDYFELFGLPVAFDIDSNDLAVRYRQLQRQFHPDRFASAPAAERRLSVQMTAQINAAFQTLKDPVARARYLLGLLLRVERRLPQSLLRFADLEAVIFGIKTPIKAKLEICKIVEEKWKKEGDDLLVEAYATENGHLWVCPKCFGDFRELFQWKVVI